MPDDEFPEYERELETGMPFLAGAQRPIARCWMTEDVGDELITETLVFPNFIMFLQPDPDLGIKVGRSIMVSPQYARSFIDALPEIIEHVNGCDCPMHVGRSMDWKDLNV